MGRIFVFLLALSLAACNTAEGVKKDAQIGVEAVGGALKQSGEAVEKAVE